MDKNVSGRIQAPRPGGGRTSLGPPKEPTHHELRQAVAIPPLLLREGHHAEGCRRTLRLPLHKPRRDMPVQSQPYPHSVRSTTTQPIEYLCQFTQGFEQTIASYPFTEHNSCHTKTQIVTPIQQQ